MTRMLSVAFGGLVAATVSVGVANGQVLAGLRASAVGEETSSICGSTVGIPSALPPDGSSPVVYLIAPCFPGRVSRTPAEAYMRDIQLRPRQPYQRRWVDFDNAAEQTVLEDFRRLWANHRLAELSVDIRNYRFPNGVIGKLVTYNITEAR